VPGARISVGYPGGSPDFEKSASRVEGFTTQLRTEFDVTMLESPEAVAEQCDAVIMTTVDGRKHLEQFSRIAGFRKPVFVDKPFAVSSDHALQIVTLAHKQGTPLMSCSAMRYAESLTKELADVAKGPLVGIDLFGPMPIEPTQGTYFWYGIHQAEAMFAALGPGCVDVQAVASESDDVVIGRWKDGRIGSMRGYRDRGRFFGATLHRVSGVEVIDLQHEVKSRHTHLLESILAFFHSGRSSVALTETLEIVRFLEAAAESRKTGNRVNL